MGKVILCTGKYAKMPYKMKNPIAQLYSVEELCYYLNENAFLLDEEILGKKLVKWLHEECGLTELADVLYSILQKNEHYSNIAGVIQRYTAIYSEVEISNMERKMLETASLGVYERGKTQVDYLVKNGKFSEAIFQYNEMLRRLPEHEVELAAKIWHNKGVALTGLFLFQQAEEAFLKSYQLVENQDSLLQFLFTKRIRLNDQEYIKFAAEFPEFYDITLEMEKKIEDIRTQWEESYEKARLYQMAEWKQDGEFAKYNAEIEKILERMKSTYRINMNE